MLDAKLVQQSPGRYAVQGDMSFATVSDLLEHGRSLFNGGTEIEVDLSGVNHADSAGLALLIEWLRNAKSRDIKIKYLSMPLQLTALAEISEIKDLFGRGA
jgi:phospholipid transport system transporter-binding protein